MRNIPLCIGYHVGPLSRLSKSCIHFYLILLDFLYFDVVLIMGNPSPLGSQLQIGHNTLLLSVILHYCLNSADKSCVYIHQMLLCAQLCGAPWHHKVDAYACFGSPRVLSVGVQNSGCDIIHRDFK